MKEYAGTRKRQPATPPTARRALRRKDWPPRRSGRHCGLSDGPGVSGGQGCERATSIHPVLFRRRRRAVGRGTGNTVCARWAAASGPLGPGLRDFAPRSFDRLTGRKQAPQNKKAGISWALEASAAPAVPGRQTGSRPGRHCHGVTRFNFRLLGRARRRPGAQVWRADSESGLGASRSRGHPLGLSVRHQTLTSAHHVAQDVLFEPLAGPRAAALRAAPVPSEPHWQVRVAGALHAAVTGQAQATMGP